MESKSPNVLYLDRDGVLNELLPGDYVKNWSEFVFRPGVLEGLAKLADLCTYIFILTNQQGIGKKLMSEQDLTYIHQLMLEDINRAGGRIDKIVYCPHLVSENCACRKPKTGMVEQLRNEFPEITSYPSFLIGDSILDFKLGQDVGAYCYGMRHIHNRDQDWSSFSIHEVSDFESFTTQLQHVLRKPVS